MDEKTPSQLLLEESVNEAVKENPSITGSVDALIEASYQKFLNNKLDDFPRMCEVARVQNKIKLDRLRIYGNKGKYTDTYGWSNDGTFCFEFDVPMDLYMFMINLVYKDFWADSNKKIHRAFMNAVCRGDDAMTLLMKVKTYYGSNADKSLTT